MNTQIENKIKASNQKYLSGLIGKVLPDRLEKQLEELDWSYLDLIHGGSQKRGTFAPLGAMELDEIAAKKEIFKEEGSVHVRLAQFFLQEVREPDLDLIKQKVCLISV